MRYMLALICTFCFVPWLALAEPVYVRSGEHDDFTRLVVHLPQREKWTTEVSEKQFFVNFESQHLEFDLSKVFDRIDRQRVAAIQVTARGLQIDLACDCSVSSHTSGERMLVLDIRPSREEAKPPIHDRQITGLPMMSATGLAMADSLHQSEKPATSKAVLPELSAPIIEHAQVRQAQERLLKQLSQAATLGLVELASTPKYGGATSEKEKPEGKSLPRSGINLNAHSGLAESGSSGVIESGLTDEGQVCIPDHLVDFSSWGQLGDFSKGLAALRSDLGGEITYLNADSAIALARHYLYFGFGAEASALLHQIPASEDVELLLMVADVIEDIKGSYADSLLRYAGCKGSIAMWAFLASGAIQPTDHYTPEAIVQAFAEIPEALQNLLGPRLAEALTRNKLDDSAQLILGIVKRQQEVLAPDAYFAEAQSQLHQGRDSEAAKSLQYSATAGASISPKALIELIDIELRSHRPISLETVDLLESYALQYRDEDIAPSLNRSLVFAYAKTGRFDQAWHQMSQMEPSAPEHRGLLDEFTALLSNQGTDFEMLRYSSLAVTRANEITPKTAQGLAHRLLGMGFPDLASIYLASPAEGAAEHERRILLAEVALSKGNFLQAKAELLGLAGTDVEAMLDRVREAEGQMVVRKQQISDASESTGPASLAQGHAALSQSQTLRDRLQELLVQTEMKDLSDN